MNHLKSILEYNQSKLYWEIQEYDFVSSDIIDEDMSEPTQNRIKNLIKDEFLFMVKETGTDKKFKYVKLTYDLKRSTINSRKFECSIFQINDDYFLVEFEYWFDRQYGDSDWSTKYFQCDTFEGLSQLLQELGLAK